MSSERNGSFDNQVVLVTGGTRGIGRVIAESFLSAGAEVIVCARHAVEDAIASDDRTATFVETDVRDIDADVGKLPGQADLTERGQRQNHLQRSAHAHPRSAENRRQERGVALTIAEGIQLSRVRVLFQLHARRRRQARVHTQPWESVEAGLQALCGCRGCLGVTNPDQR